MSSRTAIHRGRGASTPSRPKPTPEADAIDCTPGARANTCAACLMLLMSLLTVASLGVIAAGAFWTARATYRLTNGTYSVAYFTCIDDAYLEQHPPTDSMDYACSCSNVTSTSASRPTTCSEED